MAKVVDTTGAGDLFAAGFLYGYTHGRGLMGCARIGVMAAAEVIGHMGARPEVSLKDLLASTGFKAPAEAGVRLLRFNEDCSALTAAQLEF